MQHKSHVDQGGRDARASLTPSVAFEQDRAALHRWPKDMMFEADLVNAIGFRDQDLPDELGITR